MLELAVQELLKAAIAIAKDILGKRIQDKNTELLAKNREKAKSAGLPPSQVRQIELSAAERCTGTLTVSMEETGHALRLHNERVRTWSAQIAFFDLRTSKATDQVYVELDTWLVPLKAHFDESERQARTTLLDAVFKSAGHAIVLGQPGAGKTTSMKRLCRTLLHEKSPHSGFSGPILVRLRELSAENTPFALLAALSEILGLKYDIKNVDRESTATLLYQTLSPVIDALSVVLILDGFDELQTFELQRSVLVEIRALSERLSLSKLVVTCRSGEFNYSVENSSLFEIAPLSPEQIEQFAKKWLGDEAECLKFMTALRSSPFFDTAIRPLALAHMCALYERMGRIPDKPKSIYRKVVALLLEDWDEQRSIDRPSKYAQFLPDQKSEFLSHLAYRLTSTTGSSIFDARTITSAYRDICDNFSLDPSQSGQVLAELESHSGLFVQAGFDKYEFAHKSIQEYLAADHLVRLPSIPTEFGTLQRLPNELAIATAISSRPSEYFCALILDTTALMRPPTEFFDQFVGRLCLERPDFRQFTDLVLAIAALQTKWLVERDGDSNIWLPRPVDANALERFIEFRRSFESRLESDTFASFYISSGLPLVHLGRHSFRFVQLRKGYNWKRAPEQVLVRLD